MAPLLGGYWTSADLPAIVRKYMQNHYVDRLHLFLFARLRRRSAWSKLIFLQGQQHVHEALTRGKGCIIVHGHFGPIQLPLFPLASEGFNLLQIGLPSDRGLSWIGRQVAFRLRRIYESKLPAVIIEAGRYLRPVFRHLADNGVVLITGDGAGGGARVGKYRLLPFLDGQLEVPEGPVRLAQQTGAVLLPAFVIDERTGYYKFVIGRPIELNPTAKDANAVDRVAQQFPCLLEKFIRRYPWNWHFWDEWTIGARKINNPQPHLENPPSYTPE